MNSEEIVARAFAKQRYKGLFPCYPDAFIDKCVEDHWKCYYESAVELLQDLGVRAVNPDTKIDLS